MAAAARALKDYNPELSAKALKLAVKLWDENFEAAAPENQQNTNNRWGRGEMRTSAAIQLWRDTGEQKYKDFFLPKVLEQLAQKPQQQGGQGGFFRAPNLGTALELYPLLDDDFKAAVKAAVAAVSVVVSVVVTTL